MKYLVFIVLFIFPAIGNAQTLSAEARKNVRSQVNDVFNRWDDSWSVDKYNDGSASINSVAGSTSDDYDLVVKGAFVVSRKFRAARVSVNYTAYLIRNSSGGYSVDKVCYQDNSVGDSDCYNN